MLILNTMNAAPSARKDLQHCRQLVLMFQTSVQSLRKFLQKKEIAFLYRRVRHCVTEMERVLKAVDALKANNLTELGRLLYASHESLKNDYEVTGIELDTLVDQASKQKGCIGARMTGAGFGGCAIALVHKDNVDDFINNVGREYKKVVGYDGAFFGCSSGDGVSEIF